MFKYVILSKIKLEIFIEKKTMLMYFFYFFFRFLVSVLCIYKELHVTFSNPSFKKKNLINYKLENDLK